jgi:hypothetical protein
MWLSEACQDSIAHIWNAERGIIKFDSRPNNSNGFTMHAREVCSK